jgi:hypothetical protein
MIAAQDLCPRACDRAALRGGAAKKGPSGAPPRGVRLAARARVTWLERRHQRIRALLATNVALQCLDGYVTLVGTGRGYGEGNPLVHGAMNAVGPFGGIFGMKLVAIALLVLLYRRSGHPLVEPGLLSVAIAYTVFAILPWMMLLSSGLH